MLVVASSAINAKNHQRHDDENNHQGEITPSGTKKSNVTLYQDILNELKELKGRVTSLEHTVETNEQNTMFNLAIMHKKYTQGIGINSIG